MYFFLLTINKNFHYSTQVTLSMSSMEPSLQKEFNDVLKTFRPGDANCNKKISPVQLLETRARLQMSNYLNIATHRLKTNTDLNDHTSVRIDEVLSLVSRLKHKTDF